MRIWMSREVHVTIDEQMSVVAIIVITIVDDNQSSINQSIDQPINQSTPQMN
jgi:hypothetical protein